MAMLLCLCSLTAAAALPAPAAAVVTPIDIANSTQLFVDDFLVASKTANLVRSLHRPDCSRVAVTTDAPWERNYTMGLIGTNVILREDGTLQLTYSLRNSTLGCRPASVKPSANDQPPCSEISPTNPPQPNYEATAGNIYIGYAESTDGGLTFQKPLQHKYSVRGSTANNFIAIASPGSNGLSIFIDPNEQPGSPKRYRGTSADLALTSPDGKNWTKIGRMVPPSTIPAGSDEGMPGHGAFDTDGIIYWDPVCGGGGGCYSFFTRWDRAKPGAAPTSSSSGLGRAVRRADSKHLDSLLNTTCNGTHDWNPVMCPIGKWENESVVMGADTIDLSTHPVAPGSGQFVPMDYYGSTPWYQPLGVGHGIYWMAAVRFWHWGTAITGTYDIALASSRDGRNYTFVDRSPWLSPGLDGSRGSRRLWFAPPGPIRVGDEELYFVSRANTDEYSGPSIDPKSPHGEWEAEIGVGRLRLNGLVSLDSPYTDPAGAAVLTTKPIIFQGAKLFINLDAGGGGSLVVQVFTPGDTKPLLTSNFLVHNGVDLEVAFASGEAWGGGRPVNTTAIAQLAGKPVVLVLRMQDCKLYGLRFQ